MILPITSLVPIFLMMSCVTTEETNRKALRLFPESQMNIMGNQSYQDILAKEKLSNDPQLVEIVERIGKRIAQATAKSYEWEFKVIDDPDMVNAFCLPGGKVAVYTGILAIAENEAGLAAIIGHEVAHATLQHGNERISQSMIVQAGLSLAAIRFENSEHRKMIMAGLGLGAQAGIILPYSRSHESEADLVGLKYMAQAGYDPAEAKQLWMRMAALGGRVPELLSTHPDPKRRADMLEKAIPEVSSLYSSSQKQESRKLPLVAIK